MIRRCLVPVFVIAAAFAAPSPAAAQGGAAPRAPAGQAAQGADADALFKKGIRLYSDRKWKEAEAVFRAVWATNPTFDVAYNLGSTEYQLGNHVGAAEHLGFALRHFPLIDATAGLRETAQQRFDEARKQVGALKIKVNVAGAEVRVDGKSVGRAPLEAEVYVTPGEHTVGAVAEGIEALAMPVTVDKGDLMPVDIVIGLPPKPPAAPAPVDGAAPAPAPALRDTSPPREGRSEALFWIGSGTGFALIGVGAGFWSAAISADMDRGKLLTSLGGRSACWPGGSPSPRCAEVEDASAKEQTYHALAATGFAAGGAVMVSMLVYLMWPRGPQAAATGTRVAPMIDGRSGGVVAVGTF